MNSQWEPTLNTIVLVIGLLIQLGALVFYAGKFTNRITALESKVTDAETDIRRWKDEVIKLAGIETKLDLMSQEMTRVRDKLDKVLEAEAFRRMNERP